MPILPTSADVDRVSPRVTADPGVRHPSGAFESPLGIAMSELAPVFEELRNVERKTYLANTETRARGKIKEIYSQNFENPDGLKNGIDEYLKLEEETLNKIAPHVVPEFRSKFSVWTQPFFSRSVANYKNKVSEGVQSSGANLEAQSITDINDNAASIFSADPAVSRNAQTALGDSIVSLRQGIRQQTGPDMPEEHVSERADQVTQNAVVQGVRSWFQANPNKTDAFLSWKQGRFAPTMYQQDGTQTQLDMSSFSPKTKAALDAWIDQEFALSVSTADGAEKTMAALEKTERNINEFNAWSLVYSNDPRQRMKPADVVSLVHARKIDPESGKQMLDALNSDDGKRDDDALVLNIENSIYDGVNSRRAINAGFKEGRLSAKTSSRLLSLNQNQVFPDRDRPQDPYSRFRKLLHDSTQQKGPMSPDFGGEPERRARAMIEFDQQVLEFGVDPQAAFDDVLERTKVGIGSADPNTERMILPRFAVGGRRNLNVNETSMRLRQAFDRKQISRAELAEEVRRLNEWEQALGLTRQQAEQQAAKSRKGK